MSPEHAAFLGIYAFDEVDAELRLLPMAARRALDVAGLHLALAVWQQLPLADRQTLVRLGASERVGAEEVHACLRAVQVRSEEPRPDPEVSCPPSDLVQALGATRPLAAAGWSGLRALDRYVLAQLARRGRLERLAVAYDEIIAADSGKR